MRERLTEVRNAAGAVWHYRYDAAGRLVEESDFDGRVHWYGHDAAGRLIARRAASGESVFFTRDEQGRVIERRACAAVTRLEYDAEGRITTVTSPDAEVSFERDDRGRITAETINGRTVHTSYDGDLVTARTTPSGRSSRWTFDADGRPAALTAGAHVVRFGYDAAGREISRTVNGVTALRQTYDRAGRLTGQQIAGSTERGFTYDGAGRVTAIGDRSFGRDDRGRIHTVTVGGVVRERYEYDETGILTQSGDATFTYDDQGRLTGRNDTAGTWRFGWDAEDRLVEAITPGGDRWRYRYDGFGRRIAKQRVAADNTVLEEIRFAWSGDLLVEQSGPETITWDYRPDGFTPVTQADGDALHTIVTDLIGTPTHLVESTGVLRWSSRAGLWGQGPDHAPVRLRFPGQYHDAETGLHYNRFRYYDPTTARYLSPDPLGLAGGPNPVAYVPDPLTLADPLGLTSCKRDQLVRSPSGQPSHPPAQAGPPRSPSSLATDWDLTRPSAPADPETAPSTTFPNAQRRPGDRRAARSSRLAAAQEPGPAPVLTAYGMRLLPESSDLDQPELRAAAKLRPGPDYRVLAHGTGTHLLVGDQQVTAAELALMIRADPAWKGRPVTLLACGTAGPFLDELARHLPGVRIVAPTGDVWLTEDGTAFVAEVDRSGPVPRPRLRTTDNPAGNWAAATADFGPDELVTDGAAARAGGRPESRTVRRELPYRAAEPPGARPLTDAERSRWITSFGPGVADSRFVEDLPETAAALREAAGSHSPVPTEPDATAPSLYTIEEEPENTTELAAAIRRVLPDYVRESRRLGLARQLTQVRGELLDLLALVPSLDPRVARDLQHLARNDVDQFLGDGHVEPVEVDGKPAELVIRAVFDWERLATTDLTGGREITASGKQQSETSRTGTTTHNANLTLRAAVAALPPVIGDVTVTVPTGTSTTDAHTDTEASKAGTSLTLKNGVQVEVPVRYVAELRDLDGNPLGETAAEGTVELVVPRDLRRPRGVPRRLRGTPPADAIVESLIARTEPGNDFFAQVSRELPLDADGRRKLREFLDPRTIQKELHRLQHGSDQHPKAGWVRSGPLAERRSRNPLRGTRHTEVRMRLVPRLARITETVEDAKYQHSQARSAAQSDARGASRTLGLNAGFGVGTEAGLAGWALGPRAGISHTAENTQEHAASTGITRTTAAEGPLVRYELVYDLEVGWPGLDHPVKLDGTVDSFQWSTPEKVAAAGMDPRARSDWPGLHAEDRQWFAPQNLEHSVSVDGAQVELHNADGLYEAIEAALRQVPGRPRFDRSLLSAFLSANNLLGDMGDPRFSRELDEGDHESWERADAVRAALSEDQLALLLNRILGPGLLIPVPFEGIRHDYPTFIKITGKLGSLSDGLPAARRSDDASTQLKEKSSTVSGRGTTTTGEVGIDARVYGPMARLYGTLLAGIRFARTSTRSQRLGVSQSGSYHLNHGPAVARDGKITGQDLREFAAELTLTVETESYRLLNTTGRRTSIGSPQRSMPAPIRPAAIPAQTHKMDVRLLIPQDRLTRTMPPPPDSSREVTSKPIEHPNPIASIGGGYSRDLDGNRVQAFTASRALQDATMRVLRKASDNDPLFSSGATAIPLAVGEVLAPESMTADPSLFGQPTEITGLRHERRASTTTAQAKVRLRPANPRIIDGSQFDTSRQTLSGGARTSSAKGHQYELGTSVTGVGAVSHTPLPAGWLRYVPGGVFIAQLTPLARRWGTDRSRDLAGTSRVRLTGRPEHKILVQLDLDAEVTAEVHENPWHPGDGRTTAAAENVRIPDGVQMWMTEAQYHRLRAHDTEFTAAQNAVESGLSREEKRRDLTTAQRLQLDSERAVHAEQRRRLLRQQRIEQAVLSVGHGRDLAAYQATVDRDRRTAVAAARADPALPRLERERRIVAATISATHTMNSYRDRQHAERDGLDQRHAAETRIQRDEHRRQHTDLHDSHRRAVREMNERHNDAIMQRLDAQTTAAEHRRKETPAALPQRKFTDGLLTAPPVARPVGAAPATGAPSVGLGGTVTPIDLSRRLDVLRARLVTGFVREFKLDKKEARQAAERLLPTDALSKPHDNSGAVRDFLSNLNRHLPAGLNGGRTQPLRLEDRLTGRTYYLTADITFPDGLKDPTVAHVEELGTSGKVEIEESNVRSRWRQKLGGTVTARFNQSVREVGAADTSPRAGTLGAALRSGLKWGTRESKTTVTAKSVHKQSLTASGPVVNWQGEAHVELFITHGDRHLGRDGEQIGKVLARDYQVRPVEFHALPGDTLPAPKPGQTRLGAAGPIVSLDRSQHTEAAREAWRTAGDSLRLPAEPDTYAVERLLPDMAALRAAAAQAIRDSHGDVDDDTIAALESALTPDTVATALRATTEGAFSIPLPIDSDRFLYVDARILASSARLTGADNRITIKNSAAGEHTSKQSVKEVRTETTTGAGTTLAAGTAHGEQRRDLGSVIGSTWADTDRLKTGGTGVTAETEHGHKLAAKPSRERVADETLTRGLLYDVEFRFTVSTKPGVPGSRAHTGGTELAITDAVLIRMRDDVAEGLTGTPLPPALKAASQALAESSTAFSAAAAATDAMRLQDAGTARIVAAEAAEAATAQHLETAIANYKSALTQALQPTSTVDHRRTNGTEGP